MSSTTPILPRSFWFRMRFACARIDNVPREKGRLLDLPADCVLPSTVRLEGREPWSETRVAWNPSGFAIAVETRGKSSPPVHDPSRPHASDGVQFWIDTRDTRDIHRATRFCSRFVALVASAKGGAEVTQKPIARALADPPMMKPGLVKSRVDLIKGGWRLEIFLPAEAIAGFDPDTNRRLGFAHQVTDPDRGDEHLGVGRDFPIGEDPSLWATLELRD